jgi:hypothetical protein
MNNMNTQQIAEEVPFDEWMNALPSDVTIDIFDMGFRAYPEGNPNLPKQVDQATLNGFFKALMDEALGEQDQFGLDRQVGGRHYKDLTIQPIEYCYANKLGPIATLIVKYITTAGDREASGKSIREDIEKSLHCHEIWLDLLDKYEPLTEN